MTKNCSLCVHENVSAILRDAIGERFLFYNPLAYSIHEVKKEVSENCRFYKPKKDFDYK